MRVCGVDTEAEAYATRACAVREAGCVRGGEQQACACVMRRQRCRRRAQLATWACTVQEAGGVGGRGAGSSRRRQCGKLAAQKIGSTVSWQRGQWAAQEVRVMGVGSAGGNGLRRWAAREVGIAGGRQHMCAVQEAGVVGVGMGVGGAAIAG